MDLLPNGENDLDVHRRDYYARNEENNDKKYNIVLLIHRAEFTSSQGVVPAVPDQSDGKGEAPDNDNDEDNPAPGHQHRVLEGLVHR